MVATRRIISHSLEYKIVNNKSIIEKAHEIQTIVNHLRYAKIDLPKAFQVDIIIVDLPYIWNDHKKEIET